MTDIPSNREVVVHWLADTAERVVRTFVQAFAAVFVPLLPVPGETLHWDTLEKAAAAGVAAGIAAVIAFVMALAARWTGDPGTASFVKSEPADAALSSVEPLVETAQASPPPPVVVNVYQGSAPAPKRARS